MSVWPSGCVCHAVRAPGSKVTLEPQRSLSASNELAVVAGRLVSNLTGGTGVVGREKRTDHELTWLNGFHLASDLLDDAAVLVPHRGWLGDWLDATIRPQVRSAHARG